jgi:hypothetical protein
VLTSGVGVPTSGIILEGAVPIVSCQPVPNRDRDSAPFWEAQDNHEPGSAARAVRPSATRSARSARNAALRLRVTPSGCGTIHSYTIVRHQTHPASRCRTSSLVQMEKGALIAQLRA